MLALLVGTSAGIEPASLGVLLTIDDYRLGIPHRGRNERPSQESDQFALASRDDFARPHQKACSSNEVNARASISGSERSVEPKPRQVCGCGSEIVVPSDYLFSLRRRRVDLSFGGMLN